MIAGNPAAARRGTPETAVLREFILPSGDPRRGPRSSPNNLADRQGHTPELGRSPSDYLAMTIKGPWDAKITPDAKRRNEQAQALPEQLRAREFPHQKGKKINPAQINQGGAQNQEKQPPEQTGSKQVPEPTKAKGELTEGRQEPSPEAKTPEKQGGTGGA